MIYTSYFGMLNKLPKNIIPIAICAKTPAWYTGFHYKKLAPKYGFFMKWKETQDNNYYIKCFYEEVLDKLEPHKTVEELYKLLNEETQKEIQLSNCALWENENIHVALVCYEKPGDFCHRNLVATWLNENGFCVREYEIKKEN